MIAFVSFLVGALKGVKAHIILDCVEALQNGKENISSKVKQRSEQKRRNIKSAVFGVAIFAAVILMIAFGMSLGWVSEQRLKNTEKQSASNAAVHKKELALGDTVTFGTYNEEPITWRVIHFLEDGSVAVLITENIITMKAYEAAESEAFNKDNGTAGYYTHLRAQET